MKKKSKKVKLNVLCNVENTHVKVHNLPVIVLSMILNIDAIIEDLALFSMTLFKMEAIEQELKHLSKKKKSRKKVSWWLQFSFECRCSLNYASLRLTGY